MEQPVKTYSTWMMMRLAFAVQTAIKPDILIIDEALAVGDTFFQAKCKLWLRQTLNEGCSLLFVSHSINAVKELCNRAVLLDKGFVKHVRTSNDVAQKFYGLNSSKKCEFAIKERQ